MPVCVNKGCQQTYNEDENNDEACCHHPSPPIFHEGLKGWQCCKRRVMTFEEFQQIPGCTRGRHSSEAPKPKESTTTPKSTETKETPNISKIDENGVEVYETSTKYTPPAPQPPLQQFEKIVPPPEKEPEEDDPSIPVTIGTKCKRNACNYLFVDEATSRGEGPEAKCDHHPGTPIFHEGSKGWSCCSRKVLEFEEFLKIKGCNTGNHLFVGSDKKEKEEEFVQCRHDWYQTPAYIIMSIFVKKIDKEKSTIIFKEKELNVDIKTIDDKIFKQTYPLYQCIDPENSKYEFLSTKIEIKLKKANGISWPSLRSDEDYGATTTFGVQGGDATVGGKNYTLATDSPLYANKQ
ncbi:hypothetical protein Glove_22g19 [Diversispora epigaea]|uniref:CS domain-containing protein n=1 Tax=Diversispora epigaea TaxID=1348612 RepID=A0A397JTF3_9GLOM|nr:hypothetical protein Glove_22g19 [Diversispora epigaea]